MILFRYTRFLEEENKTLKERVKDLEQKNQDLILAIYAKTPILRESTEKPVEKQHKITNASENFATCSCGWSIREDDPAILQEKVSNHYRSSIVAAGRKTWPQRKRELEDRAEADSIKQEKPK